MRQNTQYSIRFIRLAPVVLLLALAGCAASGTPAPVVNRSLEMPTANAPVFDGAERKAGKRMADTADRSGAGQPPLAGARAPTVPAPQAQAESPGAPIESVPVRSGRIESSPIAADTGADDAPVITMSPTTGSEPPQVAAAGPSGTEILPAAPAESASGQASEKTPGIPPVASREPATESAAKTSNRPFIWPASGTVTKSFTDPKSMGIAIAGNSGDPVSAAADGEVIFSGLGPRGYGKLLIVRHDSELLSVYANNRALLAKEGQKVRRGEKIAELGSSGTDQPRLHFEVRRLGKPVDPLSYLPPAPK